MNSARPDWKAKRVCSSCQPSTSSGTTPEAMEARIVSRARTAWGESRLTPPRGSRMLPPKPPRNSRNTVTSPS